MNLREKYLEVCEWARGLTPRDVAERGVVLGVFLASLWLLWWSGQRILPLDHQVTLINKQVIGLVGQIDRIEQRWKKEDMDSINERYQVVAQQLFTNRSDYSTWEAELRQQAMLLALEPELKLGVSEEFKVGSDSLFAIPVVLTVRPLAGANLDTPYKRVTRWVDRVALGGKRADMVQLGVSGNSNSVAQAVLVVNLWARQKELQ